MIYNKHLDRLIEVNFVQSFMHQHNMQGKLCIQGDDSSFILHRQPYIVEFHDALIITISKFLYLICQLN